MSLDEEYLITKIKIANSLIYGSITSNIYNCSLNCNIYNLILQYFKVQSYFYHYDNYYGYNSNGHFICKNLFPSESLTYGLICIGTSIYSGIYFFYMFGGFTAGSTFGDYRVETSNLVANFGLQLFAWSILIASIVSSSYYVLKVIENLKNKQISFGKKLKLRYILLSIIIVIYVIVGLLILSVIINGTKLQFNLKDTYTYSWDTGSNPFSYDDDRIQITSYFDVLNFGIYSVKEIHLNIDIFTVNTTDTTQILLPDNTKIGEIKDVYYQEFPALSIVNESLTTDIIPNYVPGLITNNATLMLKISLQYIYAGITINLNITTFTLWTSLV
ncbi:MAG: hypothetical protein ACTSRP_21150 [Candidatus Helarchaeota archaeon]